MFYSTIKFVHDNEYRRGIKLIVVMHKICLIERFILHKNSVRLGKRLLKKKQWNIISIHMYIFVFTWNHLDLWPRGFQPLSRERLGWRLEAETNKIVDKFKSFQKVYEEKNVWSWFLQIKLKLSFCHEL